MNPAFRGGVMNRHRHDSVVSIAPLLALCVLVSGCLGQDYRRQELSITEWDHGWLAVIEPDEHLRVSFRENPRYPGVEWTVADFDPSVIEIVGEFAERPEDVPEEDRLLTIWGYEVLGVGPGETALTFELATGGQLVDVVEYTVAVVDDACDGDMGIAAPRCRREQPGLWEHGMEWEHGGVLTAQPGEEISIALTANGLHPDVPWRAVEYDSEIVELTRTQQLEARTPGNWDTEDLSEPGRFLPMSEFAFAALAPGESRVRFEITAADGEVIEICELTLVVEG
jgi:hypothetical protein